MFLTESIEYNDAKIVARKNGIDADRGSGGMREDFKKAASHLDEACLVQNANKSTDNQIFNQVNVSSDSMKGRGPSEVNYCWYRMTSMPTSSNMR